MTKLTIVPSREQTPAEKLLSGIKGIKPPPGVLQCSKCGSRTVMTTTTGASIDENGRYKRGIVCDDRICYHCDKMDVWSPMMPQTPRVFKERKTRAPKPKAVK